MKRPYRPAPLLLGSAVLHATAAISFGLAPHHWPILLGTIVANHLAIGAAGLWPQSRLLGPNLSRLPDARARCGEVGLTFDDGPDPKVTPKVLDLLDRAEARATFFCIGRRVEAEPDLAAEIVRRGHHIGNHTWSHPHAFACYLPGPQRREVLRAQEAIERATGRVPTLFRAPAGFRNLFLERELCATGLALASWTRRGYDTVGKEPSSIARRLLAGTSAGDVLLLHDGAAFTGGGNPVVLDVLPQVLGELEARGLRAVSPLPRSGGGMGRGSLSA